MYTYGLPHRQTSGYPNRNLTSMFGVCTVPYVGGFFIASHTTYGMPTRGPERPVHGSQRPRCHRPFGVLKTIRPPFVRYLLGPQIISSISSNCTLDGATIGRYCLCRDVNCGGSNCPK